jgi:hypothetical protein
MALYRMQCGDTRQNFYSGSGTVVKETCAKVKAAAAQHGTIGDKYAITIYEPW